MLVAFLPHLGSADSHEAQVRCLSYQNPFEKPVVEDRLWRLSTPHSAWVFPLLLCPPYLCFPTPLPQAYPGLAFWAQSLGREAPTGYRL